MINGFIKNLAVVCLINNINPFVKADQPVHCLKENILGSWDFHVSEDAVDVNVFQSKEICTHSRPNQVQVVSSEHEFKFAKETVWNIQLNDKYKASASKGDQILGGTWSSIYDQAIRVELEDGTRFVTNMRYNVKDSKDPVADGADAFDGVGAGSYDSFNSDCSKTMVGFVQKVGGDGSTMKKHHAQCFYGTQKKHYDTLKSQETTKGEAKIQKYLGAGVIASQNTSIVAKDDDAANTDETEVQTDDQVPADETNVQLSQQMKTKAKSFQRQSHKRFNAHKRHVASPENDMLIELINKLNLGWKADTCKYQKDHANYGDHCDALHLAQTSAKTETQDAVMFGEQDNFKDALEEARKYQKKYPSADKIPDEEVPANFDWRNVQGVDFTNIHRDQGHCGSCYTVSFTQIAEMRLKLKYGKEMPQLSPQFMMTCNYMNEGCDGGWPFFHGFLAENGHMVTEECAPYKGKTKGDHCGNYEKCEPHSKIDKTYFVGKGYGDSTEKNMMKEIMRNGLVNGELNAPHIFHMYQKGVLTENGIKKLNKAVLAQVSRKTEGEAGPKRAWDVSDKNLSDYGIEWQNLNHSVVIVGWGQDPVNDQKYWIVRNSYGSNWGDKGEFMVQRGTDDFAIEGETTAYDPVLCGDGVQC